MKVSRVNFINEHVNDIYMEVVADQKGSVIVIAQGPTSQVEHIWTQKEANMLMSLLARVGCENLMTELTPI